MPRHLSCHGKTRITALVALILTAASCLPGQAQGRSTPVTLTLDDAIALAVRHSPQIKEEQFGVLLRHSQQAQANAARFAQLELTVVGGPSPQARGNQVRSPDSKFDPDINGVFGLATFSIVQPLYAFGKINSLRQAATHGIAVSQAQVQQKATEVAMLVHEAYYGSVLATALESLADEIKQDLTKTADKVRRQLAAGAPGVDQVDLFKLETFQGELAKQLNDVRQAKALALIGLRTLTGLPAETPVTLADTVLAPRLQDVAAVERYVEESRHLRPEFTQAREGVQAYAKLVQAAQADYYPVLFVGLFGSVAESTNRDRVRNPFVFDQLQDETVAPVVGLRWKFDLGITAGKVDEAAAELGKVQQKQALAEQGIPFQVQQAYLELQQHRANIEATTQGSRSARQWLVAAVSNFDLGVGAGKDVAEAVAAYAKLRVGYLQAVYNYNIGVAKLDHRTGRDVATIQPLLPPLPGRR